jgi:hypothetical protein
MLRADYRAKDTGVGAWADGGRYLELRCGFPACRDHLGSAHPNAATPESGGERTWRLFAPETMTHQLPRNPGHWAKSRHPQRSTVGRRAPIQSGAPTAPNEYAIGAVSGPHVNTDPIHFRSNARGEQLVDWEGRVRALPVTESVYRHKRAEGLRWASGSRIPNDRRIATIVPHALAQDLTALHPRGHPLLHALTVDCVANSHPNLITFDDIEKEGHVLFRA